MQPGAGLDPPDGGDFNASLILWTMSVIFCVRSVLARIVALSLS
jgi:hypothetical protein